MADDIQSETALDERRPLLPKTDDDLDRPLPKGQLALLAFSRFVEPVAYFSIFPFCSQMVFETGIPQDQAGFYVGLIESLFSLTQLLVMPFWGKLSDKVSTSDASNYPNYLILTALVPQFWRLI